MSYSLNRIRQSTIINLQKKYNIVDYFDFIQYDKDPLNFYRWCSRWKDYVFNPDDRILILNTDCDYYTGTQQVPVGNNEWNFFSCCAKFQLPTEFFLYFTTSFGKHQEVNHVCQLLNLTPPAVIESFCIPLLAPEKDIEPIAFNQNLIQKHYVCLNGVQRLHRTLLLCYLKENNLFDQGFISYNFSNTKQGEQHHLDDPVIDNDIIFRTTQPVSRMNDFFSRSVEDFEIYRNHASNFLNQSLTIDSDYNISEFQPAVLQQGLISLVTESVFEYPYTYISEKTIKAILTKRPFVLLSSPGSLNELERLGFKTFNTVWSEEYDRIKNESNRLADVVNLMKTLCQQDIQELANQVQDIVEYNYQHYIDNFTNNDHLRWYNA